MDSRKRKPPDSCWGQIIGDATGCPPVEASSRKLFKQRFCHLCRNGGLTVPAARLRDARWLQFHELDRGGRHPTKRLFAEHAGT